MPRSCAPATSSSTRRSARRIIRKDSAKLQRKTKVVPDEALVAENAGLTEWPVPLKGNFDPAFLVLPPELIRLTMRVNQKYFACTGGDGKLAPRFVFVANIDSSDPAAVVAGNEKVLAARLADAKFFWEQDLKVPLAEQAKKLDRDRLPREARHRRRQGRARREARRMAGERAPGPHRRRGGERRRAPRQGRSGHRAGRRVPRAAGRDRRLLCPRPGPARGGRRRDPRSLQAGRAERRRAHRQGHRRGQHRRPARHAGRLLLDRREADRLARPVRPAPRRARLPADPDQNGAAPAALRRAGAGGGAADRLAARRARLGQLPGPARHGRPTSTRSPPRSARSPTVTATASRRAGRPSSPPGSSAGRSSRR